MAQFFRANKKSTTPQVQTVTVSSLDHQGRGVARQDGKVWFIDGALPGEVVKAQVTQNKAKLVEAKTVKVMTASAERAKPFCGDYEACGGCELQHQDLAAQVAAKQLAVAALFQKFTGLSQLPWQPAITSAGQHYRRSARLACLFDKDSGRLKLGYRGKGSKKIVEVQQCDVLAPAFATHIGLLREVLNRHPALSSISHVQLSEADNGSYVVLRHIKAISSELKASVNAALAPCNWHLLWQGPSETVKVSDDLLPRYHLSEFDLTLSYQLDNFVQVNAAVNQHMLQQAMAWLALTASDKVLDLFCGIGNFSLVAAKQANSVIGVEGVASSVAMATQNAHTNQISNVTFHCSDLTANLVEAQWFSKDSNVLILDPSRVGAEEILAQLPLKQFERILYVSCDPVTLARDSKLIVDQRFELVKVGLMNMFPHTGHIESMALFQRR
ncbi:23S rRNA (uracil(1939)-C(5))-methyltransferase RlmD [Pseudoalteromonas fenneropenaei]|uniref:23S rRNA (uracil(1939)-C(5))-methyltransferase RlmD n=1 Tax=Pseudoalteromonas fenneropenaei TaxID=1737459 RepID=A0ABV7CH48_9GAMM